MKDILLVAFLLFFASALAQVTLTHNVGNIPIKTGMPNCEYDENWARTFTLSNFGITTNEQFIIRSGQVAVSNAYDGARIGFSVYNIDKSFPNSSPIYLGGGGVLTKEIDSVPEIVNIEFVSPIVVPASVEKILVVVYQSDDTYNPDYKEVIIAGTEYDNDVSWFSGCREYYTYTPTTDLSNPVPDANFYINVTGDIVNPKSLGATTRLSHNFCDDLVKTINNSCSYSYIYTGRDFYLENFGISENEEYTITEGQVAYSYAEWGAAVQFNIYAIDDNFPDSFSELDLIGSSQLHDLAYFNIYGAIKVESVKFDTPVVVPAGTKRILVEVLKGLLGGGSGLLHIAGTKVDDGAPTWYKGCIAGSSYVNSDEMTNYSLWPGKDYNFYINVTGNVNHVTNNFEMNISNICSEFLKEFSVEKKENVASIIWGFGDSASGGDNTSTDLSPFHDFSADGTYTITATVTGKDGSVEVLTETVDVTEPPKAYGINNIYACEDIYGTGISSSFDTTNLLQQVLGAQTSKVVTFIDGSGNEYAELPNPFANTIKNQEAITVRVAHSNNPCCYSEISFDLIANPKPNLQNIEDLIVCENNPSGFAFFDLQTVKESVINNATNLTVLFYHENGQEILEPLSAVENGIANEEVISVHITNTDTSCYNEATFKLKVNPLPVANPLQDLIGCDDNNDGISEYFDTSNIEFEVLGNQTGMVVSYFDVNGNQLLSPLPNPYTNRTTNQEVITVRVTNQLTTCYAETPLVLKTATQPQINRPQTLYACDLGDGFASFDTSNLESELIGNQNGLEIMYFDANGNQLPSPFPVLFQNTKAWLQTIFVRVENELNSLCYSETNFDLIVNELPQINLENQYFLCDLEPLLTLSLNASFDTWEWKFQDGTIISNTFEANLTDAGTYALKVSEINNGISCENTFEFELIRSALPKIVNVDYKELSDNNYIEIVASGDGDFEYSIDGVNYQNSNLFNNVLGGIYDIYVRDKLGCGEDSDKVTIIDYPKFFTPNNDGVNDTWQIKGVKNYPNADIYIYDRYGKLLKQISANSNGWNGTCHGENMPSTDYWFVVNLDSEIQFTGHFSLKR